MIEAKTKRETAEECIKEMIKKYEENEPNKTIAVVFSLNNESSSLLLTGTNTKNLLEIALAGDILYRFKTLCEKYPELYAGVYKLLKGCLVGSEESCRKSNARLNSMVFDFLERLEKEWKL